jgi:hypothetical protein
MMSAARHAPISFRGSTARVREGTRIGDLMHVMVRQTAAPGVELELLILAARRDGCTGVDLASGALVRATHPDASVLPALRPYDIACGAVGDGEADAAHPEAVVLAAPPEAVGRLHGRRAERYLRKLVHPRSQPLLGFPGPALPYWTLKGDGPTAALVEPESRPVITGDRRCVFRWRGFYQSLPFLGRRPADRGDRVLLELSSPYDGHCYKVVTAVLSRP